MGPRTSLHRAGLHRIPGSSPGMTEEEACPRPLLLSPRPPACLAEPGQAGPAGRRRRLGPRHGGTPITTPFFVSTGTPAAIPCGSWSAGSRCCTASTWRPACADFVEPSRLDPPGPDVGAAWPRRLSRLHARHPRGPMSAHLDRDQRLPADVRPRHDRRGDHGLEPGLVTPRAPALVLEVSAGLVMTEYRMDGGSSRRCGAERPELPPCGRLELDARAWAAPRSTSPMAATLRHHRAAAGLPRPGGRDRRRPAAWSPWLPPRQRAAPGPPPHRP